MGLNVASGNTFIFFAISSHSLPDYKKSPVPHQYYHHVLNKEKAGETALQCHPVAPLENKESAAPFLLADHQHLSPMCLLHVKAESKLGMLRRRTCDQESD
uniref:Uncharacterized protein n=1 Tax=Micrurus lemniscatus lemniscatus TaxID=129467 RepID=A0A2D4HHP3_MICLE